MTIYSKNISRAILSSAVLLLSVGLLSACGHPNAMPSGYTHHHDGQALGQSVIEDNARSVPAYNIGNDDQTLSLFDVDRAVDDSLRKITARAGVPPKPVFILKPSARPTPFYNAVDSALRTSMRDLGYAISDSEAGAYAFAYNARTLRKPRGAENDGHPNVELMLQAYNKVGAGAKLLAEQAGNYFIQGAHTQNIQPLSHVKHDQNVTKADIVKPIEPAPFKRSDIIIEEPEIPVLIQEPIVVVPEIERAPDPIMPDVDFKSLSSGTVSSDYVVAPSTRKDTRQDTMLQSGKVSKAVEY